MTLRTRIVLWAALAVLSAGLAAAFLPQQARAQEVDVPALIVEAAERWELPAHRVLCIARRESGFRPGAVSPWGHVGLWQWSWRTWHWASAQAGYAGASPFDPVASTEVAFALMASDGWGHWSTARGCW